MQRKKLLIFPFDLLSHYLRCIRLAKNYSDYDVLFASSEKYNSFVTEAGYSNFSVKTFNAEAVLDKARKFNFSWLNEKDMESVFLSQVECLQIHKPDLVIGDACPTLKMAAEKSGVKYISLINGYMSKFYAVHRPLSRTHFMFTFLSFFPKSWREFIVRQSEKFYFWWIHRAFRTIRKKYDLKKKSNYLDELEGNETLICDDGDLFPQKNLPDTYTVIGPLYYDHTQSETELISRLDSSKPVICVSLGSSGDWNSVRFLSDKFYSGFNIIQAGGPKDLINGAHVFYKPFVNLNSVLPRCSLLICHGGNGTIYEGIRNKVFMLCITNHFEQEWNVERLSQIGMGMSANKDPKGLTDKFLLNRN